MRPGYRLGSNRAEFDVYGYNLAELNDMADARLKALGGDWSYRLDITAEMDSGLLLWKAVVHAVNEEVGE